MLRGGDDQCGVLSTGVQLYIEDVGECGTHSKSVQFGSMTTSTRYFLTQEQGWRRNLVRVYIGRYSYTGLGPFWMRSKKVVVVVVVKQSCWKYSNKLF